MDTALADVGNRLNAEDLNDELGGIYRHQEAVKRIEKPIRPMRRLFGENLLDRGLLRLAVQSFARVKGMEYEEAHQYLGRIAARMSFQESTPDRLLMFGQRRTRERLRKVLSERRLQKEHFGAVDDYADDGKGESPTPDGDSEAAEKSGGWRR